MQDVKCRECGQSFRSTAELQEHTERIHGLGKKGGESITAAPPNEARR